MHHLEEEVNLIVGQYQQGNLSAEERDHLLAEIRDIRAAHDCAGNEVMFRHIVQLCNIAMAVV